MFVSWKLNKILIKRKCRDMLTKDPEWNLNFSIVTDSSLQTMLLIVQVSYFWDNAQLPVLKWQKLI